ncbi:MAG: pseudouridine-5'-phosphate glycosidase [Phycisphaerales bacterium]|nr:MAG: pseudouridine-5'-phosphate glycosidase [Phycisphaerales bacterium]
MRVRHPELGPAPVALESTLLAHGVPRGAARPLADQLDAIVRTKGATPAVCAVLAGVPTVGLSPSQLAELLDANPVKTNTATLGLAIAAGRHAATTVSTTMELAAGAGVRTFATGGLGGVHRGYADRLDISADLAAFTRFPVAVVASGVKSILDVEATREALETLGVPVVGFRCDRFPAFYRRESEATVDERFDDVRTLASYVSMELDRTGRGVLICNPIPEREELDAGAWSLWLAEAERRASDAGATGRAVTPAVLGALHEASGGRTLEANLALVRANAALAGELAVAMSPITPG